PDKKNLGQFALESAQAILHFYNRYYAVPYPFGKLDMLAVPDFAAGAMENTAAIFFRETDLLTDAATASVATRKSIASVLAHEIAHQWFGNLVTMRWWDDLWLNEGFATWMANLPLHAWKPEWNIPVDEAIENQRALALDSLGTTRAIRSPVETPTEIDAAFDGIVYEKGAAVLRMIEQYVGRDTFRRGINAYLRAHAYGTATSEDFWKTIARTSGKPVDAVLATFITQPGAPVLDVTALACGGTPARARVRVAQGRFRVGPGTDLAGNQPTWRIPVCLRTAGAPVCSLVSSPRQWVSGGRRCSSWVFANAGGRGYYRTAYAPRLVRALAPHVAALTAAERLTLIDDEWALVRAGRHDAAAYLTLAAAYGREPSSGVVAELVDHLAFVREHLTTATTRAQFERFVRGLLRPTFDALGFANRPADTDDRRTLRAVVIAALGTTGDDLDIVRESRAALDRALTGGPPLDATLAASIVRVAVEHGDRPLYDAVEAASTLAASPDDRHTYFYAAAQFRDPAIVDRALARALASNVRTQDTALYLSEFFANPAARPRAWAFVKANWTALAPKLAIFGADTTLAGAVGALCDGETRDDVRQFFAAHPLPGARHSIDLALERVESCVRMTREQTAVVEAWLAARARPGQATAEQDGRPRRVPGSARRGTGPTAAERRAVRP
ncbi:MAG: M1 family aminopeptidase, partial [Acidobacteriota bacterium]